MSKPVTDSSIAITFMPSLSHLSSAKFALAIFPGFDNKTMSIVFKISKNVRLAAVNQRFQETCPPNEKRLNQIVLLIPAQLRSAVLKAAHGVYHSFRDWLGRHSKILNLKEGSKVIIYWRSNGEINRIKTAQELVLDVNIETTVRFDIACMYGFEESMRTLWGKLEASGETKNIKTCDKSLTSFGVRWLRDECKVPWARAAVEYLNPRRWDLDPIPRFSSFFPLLKSNERWIFLYLLMASSLDDVRFCLRTVTEEEKERFLKFYIRPFLNLHLQWPMQSLFLETAEKVWDYMSGESFIYLLHRTLDCHNEMKHFDYGELFEGLWSRSPNRLRESAKLCPILREKIDKYMSEKRSKKKSDDEKEGNTDAHRKHNSVSNALQKWIRNKNGRLRSVNGLLSK